MTTEAPGFEEATKHGYEPHATIMHPDGSLSATYVKGPVGLCVSRKDGHQTASLSANFGLVVLRIEDFAFPHGRFEAFEEKIREAWEVLQENGK